MNKAFVKNKVDPNSCNQAYVQASNKFVKNYANLENLCLSFVIPKIIHPSNLLNVKKINSSRNDISR